MKGRTQPPQAPRFPSVIKLKATTKDAACAEAAQFAKQGMTGIWIVQELHDDRCLAGDSHRDRDCICTPDYVLMEISAHQNFMAFDRSMRAREKTGLN